MNPSNQTSKSILGKTRGFLRRLRRLAGALALLGVAVPAGRCLAFNPPTDRAGPLVVQIDGPEQVTQVETPQKVQVVVENRGDAEIRGTVQVRLIDSWRSEPAGPTAFRAPAQGTTTLDFRVTAGRGTYSNVFYPIHALAEFQVAGQPCQAHPILLVKTRLDQPAPPAPTWDWRPGPPVAPPPKPRPFPPPDTAGSHVLGAVRCGDTAYDVRIWPGSRGLLDAAVAFTAGPRLLAFNGFHVRVMNCRLQEPGSRIILTKTAEEPCPDGCQVRHFLNSPAGDFELVGRITVWQGVLRTKFSLEHVPPPQPWRTVHLEDLAIGPWSLPPAQVYAGPGNVIRQPGVFDLNFDGHRLATSFVGMDFVGGPSLVLGSDLPPSSFDVRPADRICTLHAPHEATLTLIPAATVWDGAKTWRAVNGLKAAAGVPQVAGRFVFDLWGGRYADATRALRRAFRYGLTDAMVIWHNWQRWGYDYRLPDIFPPNPSLGTLEEMQALAHACKEAGVLLGPHDNYIDFYPDADGFSYDQQIAFRGPGQPVPAWLNQHRKAQSYRYRADQIEPFLQRNVQWVRQNLAATAYFIDVWSSAPPYDYWTADGRFFSRGYTRDVWGRQFAWIRDAMGGAPQISESGHDALIGWLDGAQTNHLRVGKPVPGRHAWCAWNIPCADAERVPWFDAAHHDRFILHGAGYPGRYEGGLDPRAHGISSDDYVATEVLTGHPAMVSEPFGPQIVRKYWLLHALGRALALRTIELVEFDADSLHRQHVAWSGGGDVWVNRGDTDWRLPEAVLPPYGFLARVPTPQGPVEAAIVRRDGSIVESARWPDACYVNGRLPLDDVQRIRLDIEKIEPRRGREFEMTLRWQAEDPIPAGWAPFLHFVDTAGEILFQAGHRPRTYDSDRRGTFSASAHFHVPEKFSPGQSLELRTGIYHPAQGQRLAMAGWDDGQLRIRLGRIRLEGQGQSLTGVEWHPEPAESNPLLTRWNPSGKPIDFGPIVTAGGCRLSREGQALVVTPLPQAAGRTFTAEIRPSALPWRLPALRHCELIGEDGKVLSRQPVRAEGDRLVIACPSEAFTCRLVE